ncbi:Golgi membrane protein 1 [Neosynchiropus ocellatus]
MGGLGNGRRAGRSPPLLIGALIACILVLGFNYWMSSSRNLELQTKLYELDGKVRRGAAEQEVAQMKRSQFLEEIQRQKEQMGHIESLYKRQLEGAQNTCSQEKVILLHNVSSSTKVIHELKGQLNQLSDDLGKLQRELQSCHGNINTLNNKLTYDMTHCNSQVLAQKELCDERVAAAKIEIQKKMEHLILSSSVQENTAKEAAENTAKEAAEEEEEEEEAAPEIARSNAAKAATTEKQIPEVEHQKESLGDLANELVVAKDPDTLVDLDAAKEHPQMETHSVATVTAQKHEILPAPEEDDEKDEDDNDNNGKDTGNDIDNDNGNANDTGNDTGNDPDGDDDVDDDNDGKTHLKNLPALELMDVHKEETNGEKMEGEALIAGVRSIIVSPYEVHGVHGMLHGEVKQGQKPVDQLKLVEPDDYDADDGGVAGANPVKPQGENTDKGREQAPANYNGDDENVGEFEADKQAQLAGL